MAKGKLPIGFVFNFRQASILNKLTKGLKNSLNLKRILKNIKYLFLTPKFNVIQNVKTYM
jgi:hypothetical protein